MLTLTSRFLGASEAYYQLVDRLWSANSHCAVEIAADIAAVRAAWAATVARMPVLGARIRHVDGQAEVVFGGSGVPEIWRTFETVEDAIAAQADEPLDTTVAVVRCALVEGVGMTTAVIATHHSLIDGRGLGQISLILSSFAAGEDPAEQPLMRPSVSIDSLIAERADERLRRRELLGLAREVRGEESYIANADPLTWHETALERPRDLASYLFRIDSAQTSALRTHARAIGATMYGLSAAAVLRSCAELSPGVERLALATPIDLRAARQIPATAPVGQAAALISSSYDVTRSDSELAREISSDVRRRVDRGEGELLFALSRAERIPIGPESDEIMRDWTSAATPSVCVSNVGVIAPPLPSAIRGLTIAHAPTPNQSLFFVTTTLGDTLHAILCVDRNRVSIDGALLAKAIETRLAGLAATSE